MARVTKTIHSICDTCLDNTSTHADTNFGKSMELGISNSSSKFAIIKADASIPNKKAVSILLKLCVFSVNTNPSSFFIAKLLGAWDVASATYNNAPPITGVTEVCDAPTFSVPQTVSIDLTNYISLEELANGFALLCDGSITACSSRYIGVAGREAMYFEIEYADAPGIPDNLSPANGEPVTLSNSNVRFSWRHNPSTVSNLPQKGYSLQISANGVDWTTLTGTTTNQYADIAVSNIPSGNFYWRVKTVDTDDVPSDYSNQAYSYYGTAPTTPSITTSVFETSKPRIEWTTVFDQSAFKVQVLLGETKIVDVTIESENQYYDVPVELVNDTQYTVRVSAKDDEAHYSGWAEDAISTDYGVPETPTFVAAKKKQCIELTITNPTGDEEVIRNDIYRLENGEYIRIGSTDGTLYNDWSPGNGTQYYKVAAVGNSGQAMSEAVSIDYSLSTAFLTAVSDPNYPFEVKYNANDKISAGVELNMMEYAGRNKPVAEFGEVTDRSISVAFASNDKVSYEKLYEIVRARGTVLFRNNRIKMYGVCSNATDAPADYFGMIYNLSFLVSEIEHSEAI